MNLFNFGPFFTDFFNQALVDLPRKMDMSAECSQETRRSGRSYSCLVLRGDYAIHLYENLLNCTTAQTHKVKTMRQLKLSTSALRIE